jgi:hypothetical protein
MIVPTFPTLLSDAARQVTRNQRPFLGPVLSDQLDHGRVFIVGPRFRRCLLVSALGQLLAFRTRCRHRLHAHSVVTVMRIRRVGVIGRWWALHVMIGRWRRWWVTIVRWWLRIRLHRWSLSVGFRFRGHWRRMQIHHAMVEVRLGRRRRLHAHSGVVIVMRIRRVGKIGMIGRCLALHVMIGRWRRWWVPIVRWWLRIRRILL